MMISTKGRYALRILSDLAQLSPGEYASVKDISDSQQISQKYLESITSVLLKANFVESRRGRTGGYRLTRPASEYTLLSVLKLTEGSISPVSCIDHEEVLCGRDEHCIAYPLWLKLDSILENYLGSVSVEDLVNGTL
ncbi:MAG: Rrf2 family transcriptional regulator [Clostridiales bacterium]|nr:Rrf2 family transcriptional regulator [Clostridiales bacterium]